MRSLDFPEAELPNGFEALDASLSADKPLTEDERRALKLLIADYVTHYGRGDKLKPCDQFNTKERGEDFREAYKQTYSKGKLKRVRSVLKKLAANRCPCCGGSRPGQIDHHLPKVGFAEFAVLPMNLVAYCEGCNGKKLNHIPALPEQAFIHPYFDDVPDTPFVAVAVTVSEAVVQVVLSFDDAAAIDDPVMKSRMKFQFERVDVNARIADEVTEVIREHADLIANERNLVSAEQVAAYLEGVADSFVRTHHQGYWKVALFRALAVHADFCNGGFRTMLVRKVREPRRRPSAPA